MPAETERGLNKELEAIKTWHERHDQIAIAAEKRWKAVVESDQPPVPWTAGQEYVRLWKERVRPNCSPAMARFLSPPLAFRLQRRATQISCKYYKSLNITSILTVINTSYLCRVGGEAEIQSSST